MYSKLLIFSFITFTLFNCSNLKSNKDLDKSPLIFLHYWSDEMNGGIDSMISKFNNSKPGYKIRATGFDHESFKISMKVMLSSGNPPDLFSYWAGARTASLVKKNYLNPIDKIWNDENIYSKFPQSIIDACTYNGKAFIVPVTQHYVAFFYNKQLFNNLKIDPPKTWLDFISVCNTFKKNGITPLALGSQSRWPAQFWFDYILLRTAGAQYRNKLMTGKASYIDDEVVNCFKIWSKLIKSGFFNNNCDHYEWSDAAQMVADKKAAMTLMGTWITGFYDSQLSLEQERDYDYFSFPIINEKISKSALGPIDAILLPKKSNIKKAETVLALFTEADVQKAMSVGSGALSPSIEVLPDSSTPIQNKINKELKSISNWAFNYDLATPPKVAELGLQLFEQFLKNPSKYNELLKNINDKINELPADTWY